MSLVWRKDPRSHFEKAGFQYEGTLRKGAVKKGSIMDMERKA